MKNFIFIVFLFFAGQLFSQHLGAVTGTILDSDLHNEPLLMANVAIQNSLWKTHTNFHGYFELSDVDPGSYVLVISYPGYETLEVPITLGDNEVIRIAKGLQAKSISFNELTTLSTSSSK